MVIPVKFSGKIWLNGEFGVSRQREALFSSKIENDYHCPIHKQVMRSLIDDWGVSSVLDWILRGKAEEGVAIGSSMVTKSHKSRKARGSGGITPYGRKMLRNAATLLQNECGHHRLSFLTLTVPQCSEAEYRAIAGDWSEITRQYQQYLRRCLTKRGLSGELVVCSEIQEERYEATGLPCLHLHLCFQGKPIGENAWVVTPKQCAKGWKSILKRYLPNCPDWRAVENLRQVRKSAAGYLGKYMSKGARAVSSLVDAGRADMLPSAWWNCTFSLRRRVLAGQLSGYKAGDSLINLIDSGRAECFHHLAPIMLPLRGGGEYIVGWFGRLKSWAYQMLKSEIEKAKLDRHGKISLVLS